MPQQDKDLILHQPRKPLPQSPHILALPQQQLSDDPPDLLQLPSISLLPAMSWKSLGIDNIFDHFLEGELVSLEVEEVLVGEWGFSIVQDLQDAQAQRK